jgi:mevalonate kinase
MTEQSIEASCPGKVFILGEYACLVGHKALVSRTEKLFTLSVYPRSSSVSGNDPDYPFHPDSPAGRLLSLKCKKAVEWQFLWNDPFPQLLGVGSSSAQFVLVSRVVGLICGESIGEAKEAKLDSSNLVRTFRELTAQSGRVSPSGIDVLAQDFGMTGVFSFDGVDAYCEAVAPQPFDGQARFVLAYTGAKVRTHEHLKDLYELGFPDKFTTMLASLRGLTQEGISAWAGGNAWHFGDVMNRFQRVLSQAGLASPVFSKKVSEISKWGGVLGCKGAGSQGGDCILVLCEERVFSELMERLERERLIPYDF